MIHIDNVVPAVGVHRQRIGRKLGILQVYIVAQSLNVHVTRRGIRNGQKFGDVTPVHNQLIGSQRAMATHY